MPQGGNTGLVGGQIPDESGREIVLSLERLDKIRGVDAVGATVVAEAGVVLERLQEAAERAGMLFPLSLGSQGSCRIGGNISTNAGGTQVLAYGNTRSLVLGLEVVLPTGEIWNGLRGLIKDNSGYDLKQLFIGAEGTLGVVTAAVLEALSAPERTGGRVCGGRRAARGAGAPEARAQARRREPHRLRAHAADRDRDAGEALARRARSARHAAPLVRADGGLLRPRRIRRHELMLRALGDALAEGTVADAAIASSLAQAQEFWRMRHGLSEIQKHEGSSIKHDVSVPIERVPDLIERGVEAVGKAVPGVRPVPFGHLGDGNIHFNFSQPLGADAKAFMARAPEVHRIVDEIVTSMGGSIAAEHGIGRYKRELLKGVKSEVELQMMRKLKRTFDPNNILNPGRVV